MTIRRAQELLRTDPQAYWRDAELQEAQFEALERQQEAADAGATPPPGDDMEIERKVAQGDVDRFANLLRTDPAAYWRSETLQQQHRDAIARTLATTPAGRAAAGSTAPAGPAAPPDRAADQRRHDEIVGLMRDPVRSTEYWRSTELQQEFRDVVDRLGSPGSAPAAQAGGAVSVEGTPS